METIIRNYLEANYEMTVKTYVDFKLYDKILSRPTYIKNIEKNIIDIFSISNNEFDGIWDKWLDEKITNFENKVVDVQYMIYEKTGLTIDLRNPRWASLLDDRSRDYLDKLVKDR